MSIFWKDTVSAVWLNTVHCIWQDNLSVSTTPFHYGDWRDYAGTGMWAVENGHESLIALKGQGVWPFVEQEDKWGYLNNPRWRDQT